MLNALEIRANGPQKKYKTVSKNLTPGNKKQNKRVMSCSRQLKRFHPQPIKTENAMHYSEKSRTEMGGFYRFWAFNSLFILIACRGRESYVVVALSHCSDPNLFSIQIKNILFLFSLPANFSTLLTAIDMKWKLMVIHFAFSERNKFLWETKAAADGKISTFLFILFVRKLKSQ